LGADFAIINAPSSKLGKAAYYFEKKLERIVKKFVLYSQVIEEEKLGYFIMKSHIREKITEMNV
jgi:hypothetical protein